MRFKRQRAEEIGVNLTPLIDVVFLLLIFFMVSTSFTRETHLSLELPKSSSEAKLETPDLLDISISADGQYAINDRELVDGRLETLKRGLAKAAGDRTSPPVVITADAQAPHQAVVRAMDAAGQLGFVKLSITTQPAASD